MQAPLHKYQQAAIDFVLASKACYLALDAGLGKTRISLEVIASTKQKALVIAPKNVALYTWPEEIKKWFPKFSYRVLQGHTRTLRSHEDIDILILTYDNIVWFCKQRIKFKPRMLILDESTAIKSHATQRFKWLARTHPLWTEYKICLSATPEPNDMSELWTQFYMLDRGKLLGKNITAFRRNWCVSEPVRTKATQKRIYNYKAAPQLEKKLRALIAPYMFSLKAEDWLQMPKLITNYIPCSLSASIQKIYKKIERDFVYEAEHDNQIIEAGSKAGSLMKLRQIVQGGYYELTDQGRQVWTDLHTEKLDALKTLTSSTQRPILCCIQFKGELAMIRKEFGEVPVIAGGIPQQLVRKYITQWNAGSLPLLLVHPASISHGMNLQSGGNIIVWYGLPWSFEQCYQLERRLYRQGQKEDSVIIHYLVMKNTIDEVILKALKRKASLQEALLSFVRNYHK